MKLHTGIKCVWILSLWIFLKYYLSFFIYFKGYKHDWNIKYHTSLTIKFTVLQNISLWTFFLILHHLYFWADFLWFWLIQVFITFILHFVNIVGILFYTHTYKCTCNFFFLIFLALWWWFLEHINLIFSLAIW